MSLALPGRPHAESPRTGVQERMPWGSAVLGALVVAFVRPAAWPVAVAGFLARGGIVLLLVPVLAVPTPTGIANAVGGPVSSLLFGSPSPSLVAVLVGSAVGAFLVLLAGAVVAGWSERIGIREALQVAGEEAFVPREVATAAPGGEVASLATLRLLGLLPPAIALALSGPVLYDAAYRELILPAELRTPLALRILRDVPGTVLMVLAAWLVADAAASISIRRHVLERRGVVESWVLGWLAIVRRPIRTVATAFATAGLTLLLVGPAILASAATWTAVRDLLREDRDPIAIVAAVLLFVALWIGGLVLAAVAATFRGAAWTFEVVRMSGASPPGRAAPRTHAAPPTTVAGGTEPPWYTRPALPPGGGTPGSGG